MSRFPHDVTLPGDANLDGRVNTADYSALVSNWGKSVKLDQPETPRLPAHSERLLYVQISAPQIGDTGAGWNSAPDKPWLNAAQHGIPRVWDGLIRRQLDRYTYTGVVLSGFCGVQDSFTAVHGSRNHGAVSGPLLISALGDNGCAEALAWLESLSSRCPVVLYYGGADKPIKSAGLSPVPTDMWESEGVDALRDGAGFADDAGARIAYDALSFWPMKAHTQAVLSLLESGIRKPLTEGPAEHPDPIKLRQIMARCDEIGMVDDGPNGWLANSPHAQLMLDPRRRMWKAVHAPTCREYWMCNGHWSDAGRESVEATARKYGITLIDQMRTV